MYTIGVILLVLILGKLFFFIIDNYTPIGDGETLEFRSAITRGGSIVAPEKLLFDNEKVVWIKNHGIDSLYTSTTTITILYKNIVGISIERNIIGCNIRIIGNGVNHIYAKCFTDNDATIIDAIVNELIDDN